MNFLNRENAILMVKSLYTLKLKIKWAQFIDIFS